MKRTAFGCFFLIAQFFFAPAVLRAQEEAATTGEAEPVTKETCLSCHGDASMAKYVNPEQFERSVHGPLDCTACHTDAATIPHPVPLQSLRFQNIPATCGQCHSDIQAQFDRSIHGQAVASGRRGAPVCTDCHGVHSIALAQSPESLVSKGHLAQTCARCHAAAPLITRFRLPSNVVGTYMESYHGLAAQLGSVTAANCASCHGAHEILPASDENSTINPANLQKTCGACHAGVTAQVAKGKIHVGSSAAEGENHYAGLVRRFYLWLIMLVLGGMFLHNLTDFLNKLGRHRRNQLALGHGMRMTLIERLQHFVLIAAFVILAYTGFALKFPHAWWARLFFGHSDWRSLGHRWAAVAFCLLGLFHLGYVLLSRKGRAHLRELVPTQKDLIQPFQLLAFNLGLRKERPQFGHYSYIEKAEYWALIWGSMVMAITGFLLMRERLTLAVFPKWVIDVLTTIHYYEAILACGAIVLWHFYFVIFDPDEYPMKWTWISGKGSVADRANRRGAGHSHKNEG